MSRDSNLATILPMDSKPANSYKDGGDEEVEIAKIEIDFAINGFCVTFLYIDGTYDKEIHESMDQVLESIKQSV